MKRVLVVITARPSYSRIYSALVALRTRRGVELLIVAAASAVVHRFGRIVDQIRADGFAVAEEIPALLEPDSLANSAASTGLLTERLAECFVRLRPDVVVTIADRHETLATAIAASYQHIPLCHVQGGEVTGSIDDKVRDAVTHLADLHCVSTKAAAHRVTAMIASWRPNRPSAPIYWTGCPSIDLAAEVWREGGEGEAFFFPEVEPGTVVVLQHPVTDEAGAAADQMRATVRALQGLQALFFWPGEDAAASAMCKVLRDAGIRAVRNIPPLHFLRLLRYRAAVLVGNSSVGIRECSYLGVPVVNIGTRQQGRERGPNVVDVGHDADAIRSAVLGQMGKRYERSTLYGDGRAGERVAAVLAGDAPNSNSIRDGDIVSADIPGWRDGVRVRSISA